MYKLCGWLFVNQRRAASEPALPIRRFMQSPLRVQLPWEIKKNDLLVCCVHSEN